MCSKDIEDTILAAPGALDLGRIRSGAAQPLDEAGTREIEERIVGSCR